MVDGFVQVTLCRCLRAVMLSTSFDLSTMRIQARRNACTGNVRKRDRLIVLFTLRYTTLSEGRDENWGVANLPLVVHITHSMSASFSLSLSLSLPLHPSSNCWLSFSLCACCSHKIFSQNMRSEFVCHLRSTISTEAYQ